MNPEEFHRDLMTLTEAGWTVTFSAASLTDANPYLADLQRNGVSVIGAGGNPLTALFDAQSRLGWPVDLTFDKPTPEQIRRYHERHPRESFSEDKGGQTT